MPETETTFEQPKAAEEPPPPGSSIKTKVLLALLALFITSLFSARPLYEWQAKHRAAERHEEIAALKGSEKIEDWQRLLDLTKATVGINFPPPLSWLFIISENRIAIYDVSVHTAARDVLPQTILKDRATTVRALTSGRREIASWVWTQLNPTFDKHTDDEPGIGYQDVLTWIWQGDDEESVRDFVMSGTIHGAVAAMPFHAGDSSAHSYFTTEIRCRTLRRMVQTDEMRALPIAAEFLRRNPDIAAANETLVRFLQERMRAAQDLSPIVP